MLTNTILRIYLKELTQTRTYFGQRSKMFFYIYYVIKKYIKVAKLSNYWHLMM